MVRDARNTRGRLLSKNELQKMAGLHTFMALFLHDGAHGSNAVYACLQLSTNTDLDMKVLSRDSIREMEAVLIKISKRHLPLICREVRFWHPGATMLAPDAIGSHENTLSGWGVRTMGFMMGAAWTKVTRAALREGTVSINPLELIAAARLVKVIAENNLLPTGLRTVVIRVDNMSACACVNAGRALSKTMRKALKIMMLVQEASAITIIAQHVRTEDNEVADRISRGCFKEAEKKANGAVTWLEDEGVMAEWEDFVCGEGLTVTV